MLQNAGTAAGERPRCPSRIILTMAGIGSRFGGSRFVDARGGPPKLLIDVAGRPMVWWALRSLAGVAISRLVFVVLDEHEEKYRLSEQLPAIAASCFKDAGHAPSPVEVVVQKGLVPGQLRSALEARAFITADEPVLIAGADTLVVSNIGHRIDTCDPDCRGLISVANLPGDRWSFARVNEAGAVVDVAEKRRISDHASTGLYWFACGAEFLGAANASIRSGPSHGCEHYVMPAYTELIKSGLKVELVPAAQVWDMGMPEALEVFLAHLRDSFLATT